MIKLATKDASILARVAQYDRLPRATRLRMLAGAGPTARKIGRIVIGASKRGSPEIVRAANVLKLWAEKNKSFSATSHPENASVMRVSARSF